VTLLDMIFIHILLEIHRKTSRKAMKGSYLKFVIDLKELKKNGKEELFSLN
jgi:hypothetical protein